MRSGTVESRVLLLSLSRAKYPLCKWTSIVTNGVEIFLLLGELDPNKSPGNDAVHPRLLQVIAALENT